MFALLSHIYGFLFVMVADGFVLYETAALPVAALFFALVFVAMAIVPASPRRIP